MAKGVDSRNRQTEEEHREVERMLMSGSRLRDETREDRRHNGKKANLKTPVEQQVE